VRSGVRILAFVALAAGCGGGGGSKQYAVAATQRCLRDRPVHVLRASRNTDYSFTTAPAGALKVVFDGQNAVTIEFEQTSDGAKQTQAAVEASAGTSSRADRRGNTVLIWSHDPSSSQRSTVEGCLSE
jgi:hypothetical protein